MPAPIRRNVQLQDVVVARFRDQRCESAAPISLHESTATTTTTEYRQRKKATCSLSSLYVATIVTKTMSVEASEQFYFAASRVVSSKGILCSVLGSGHQKAEHGDVLSVSEVFKLVPSPP
jgi:hypothetical protein